MNIEQCERRGIQVVLLTGQIDARSAGALHNALKCLVSSGTRRLVVDMMAVESIARRGLRTLISLANRLPRNCMAVCAGEDVRRTLQVAALGGVFHITSSRDEAVEWLLKIQAASPLAETVGKFLGVEADTVDDVGAEPEEDLSRLADAMLATVAFPAGYSPAPNLPASGGTTRPVERPDEARPDRES